MHIPARPLGSSGLCIGISNGICGRVPWPLTSPAGGALGKAQSGAAQEGRGGRPSGVLWGNDLGKDGWDMPTIVDTSTQDHRHHPSATTLQQLQRA